MKNNIIFFLFILCWLLSFNSFAQTPNPFLSPVFSELQLDSVSTGYLLDTALEYADLHKYNGALTSNNYSDLAVFRNILATINSSRVNSRGAAIDANAFVNSLADTSTVNLGIAVFKYNYIASNALSSGLLNYQDGKLHYVSVNGIWQNPFLEGYVVAVTPNCPCISGTSVRFKYSGYTNFSGNVSTIDFEFDAGDGRGYQPVLGSLDETVTYTSTGDKTLKLRITLSDQTVLESHAIITLLDPPPAPSCSATPPTGCCPFFLASNPQVNAKVSYKSSHSGAVVKPFIFVEGFDSPLVGLLSSSDWCGYIRKSITLQGMGSCDFSWLYDNHLTGAIKDNFDVFYVDFGNPYADIKDNAALLVQILDWINNQLKQGTERNVIVGHSMGGLIARYALCSMELSNPRHPHQTDYYVSYDAPHLGVNVPIGLQYAVRDLYEALYGTGLPMVSLTYRLFDPLVFYLICRFHSPSATQMMYYFVPLVGDATDAYHQTWQAELNSVGFPKGDEGHPIENLSIVNGGDVGTPNQSILDLRVRVNDPSNTSFSWLQSLLLLVAKTDNIHLSFQAKRNSGGGSVVSTSRATIRKSWPWISGSVTVPLMSADSVRVHYAPMGSPNLDYSSSSYLSFSIDTINLCAGIDSLYVNYTDPVLFVPSASALSDPLGYNRDYYNSAPIPKEDTPFDSFYLNNVHKHHGTSSTSPYWTWIKAHTEVVLNGPSGFVQNGDTFSISGLPSDYESPDWSRSDAGVTVTNGVVTVNDPGSVVRIRYMNHNGGAYICKSRKVLAGFPHMALEAQRLSGSQYRVSASCTTGGNDGQSHLNELTSNGVVQYIWGTKNASNSYIWSDTTSVSHFDFTAPSGAKTYVCMKLLYMSESSPRPESVVHVCTIDRTSTLALLHDPQEILVNHIGFSMPYQFVSDISSYKYFAVWCNPDYTGTVIAPDTVVIGNLSYPVATSFTQNVNGDSATVYCFDIKNDPTLLQTVSDVRDGTIPPQLHPGVPITIKGNNITIESLLLPVISAFPGPLTPIND